MSTDRAKIDASGAFTFPVNESRAAPIAAQLIAEGLPPLPEESANIWYHHGLPNFDDTDKLRALDDDTGKAIPLYTAERVRQAQRDAIEPYAERIRQLERELAEGAEEAPEWIILQRTGCVPELKGPLDGAKQTEDMLREMYDLYPGCICTLAAVPRTSYPQSGREWIAMHGDKRRKPLPAYIDGRTAGTAGAEPVNVQWWLASVDQYGNATLVDGAHGDMAGANKAAFLFDRMGLTNGRKLAAAKVELYEPKPSADGVNMDAVRECNRARLAAAPSPQSPAGGEGQA